MAVITNPPFDGLAGSLFDEKAGIADC